MLLLLCLVASSYAGTVGWLSSNVWSGTPAPTTCTGNPTYFAATPSTVDCSTLVVNCTCAAGICVSTSCTAGSAPPAFPSGVVGYTTYNAANCASGSETSRFGYSGSCTQATASSSYGVVCSGSALSVATYANGNCNGAPASTVSYSGCQSTSTASVLAGCGSGSGVCFHESTLVQVGERTLSLEEIRASRVCAIPHVVHSDGVVIHTSCPKSKALRLTRDHLVFTARGLVAAGDIKVHDFLFTDKAEKNTCQVVKVEKEERQTYFGLNCEDSVVLANGYKASTFGYTHTIPSLWMKYASKVVGLEKASAYGDRIVEFLRSWNIISRN
jgi:hypothetical protein